MKIRVNIQIAVFTVLVAMIAIGCGSRWLAGGKLHFQQERYDQAKETFESAILETPDDPEAHLWLGRALAELREDERAVQEILRADELVSARKPELKEEIRNTLKSYWSQRYNPGLGYAKEAASAKRAGNVEEKVRQLELAVDEFRRSILFCPDSVQNYKNLGQVLFQLDNRQEGMAAFQKARELGGDDPALQRFLFGVFRSLGAEALEDAAEAAQSGDKVKSKAGYENGISMFEEAATFQQKVGDQIAIYFNIGYANYNLSDLAEGDDKTPYLEAAKLNYLKVLELDEQDQETLRNVAYAYADLSDFDNALIYGQKLLDEVPWETSPWGLMVTLYNKADNREKSVAYGMVRTVLSRGDALPGSEARAQSKGTGPRSDMQKVLQDRGMPMQVYTYTSQSRGDYHIWFYWTEGRVYTFQKGKEVFRGSFEALSDEMAAEVISG